MLAISGNFLMVAFIIFLFFFLIFVFSFVKSFIIIIIIYIFFFCLVKFILFLFYPTTKRSTNPMSHFLFLSLSR